MDRSPRHFPPRRRASLRIALVGAGFAGIGAAVVLRRAGFTDVTVFERGQGVGGTWRENTYPGAACDVPSHLYSFSFAPKHDWSFRYARQPEILAYLEDVTDRFDLRRHIRFGVCVTSAVYDERDCTWHVHGSDDSVGVFDVFLPAVGQLSTPSIPAFAGLQSFQGAAFHAARWDHSAAHAGKRVAVVGSAASAVQIVPELARSCTRLSVFQRTPNWIAPRMDHGYGPRHTTLLRHLPGYRRLTRAAVYAYQEGLFGAFRTGSRRNDWFTKLARWHLARQVPDPALRAKLTPDYTLGCKRLLLSDDYLPAFSRPNVELVTEAIDRFTPEGIRTRNGIERALDVVVFATGFDVRNCLAPVQVTGRGGLALREAWADGPHAYHGVASPGFPNMFFLYGPNTNLGHSSIVFMLECQFRYVARCLAEMVARGAASFEVRDAACRSYNDALYARLDKTVWATGCGNWYGQDGKITANWSGSTTAFWRQMRRPRMEDFVVE